MRVFLLLTLALLTGCASTRSPETPPCTLAEVNAALGNGSAVIVLTDSQRVPYATQIRVGPERVTYTDPVNNREGDVLTAEVARIERRVGHGLGRGIAWGAAPGAVVVALSLLTRCESDDQGCGLGKVVANVYGAGAALLGGLIGGAIGQMTAPGEIVTLYEGPVSRYVGEHAPPSPAP